MRTLLPTPAVSVSDRQSGRADPATKGLSIRQPIERRELQPECLFRVDPRKSVVLIRSIVGSWTGPFVDQPDIHSGNRTPLREQTARCWWRD